ncbi:MAG: collagen-binding domain-containing protein, partial [Bacteroidota bacterium]
QYILLNFPNATRVNINNSRTIFATVFAPYAAVAKNNSNNIDGQVIAKSFSMKQCGEVHHVYYLGDDPTGSFPVEWGEFEVAFEKGVSQLHWSTLQESNTSHFVIERSLDAERYAPVGQVEAAGDATQTLTYQFTDQELPILSGLMYYRLAQIDLDGSMSYSVVRHVRVEPSLSLKAHCYPNPTSNWVNLSWESSENLDVQVLTLQGQVLATHHFSPIQRNTQLDLSTYPAGKYLLQLRTPTQVEYLSVYRN